MIMTRDLTSAFTTTQQVFTPQEVATVLRVSSETIRRKIVSGELHALEVGGKERKQYRIFGQDLVNWLGQERVGQLFGLSVVVAELRAALEGVSDAELDHTLEEALKNSRDQRVVPPSSGLPMLSREAIAERFKNRRLQAKSKPSG